MKKLSDLPIGAKIKEVDTKYNGHTIVWIVADKNHKGYPANTVTLISERILTNRRFANFSDDYSESEIRKWINDSNGLMKDFSSKFMSVVKSTNLNLDNFGGEQLFIASAVETDIESSYTGATKLALFNGNDSRVAKDFNNDNKTWWLRDKHPRSISYNIHKGIYIISPDGSSYINRCDESLGVRPLCNIKSDVFVSSSPDSNGVYTITWDKPPSIESTTSGNMGLQNKEFEFTYKVSDEDNPTLTVNEYLDGKSTKQFTTTSGSTYTFSLSRLAYQKLLNGNHTIKIVADDNEGGVAEKVFNFSKNETKILFELQKPLQADAMVTKALINLVGSIPEKAILKIEACNNGNDAKPTWEDVTDKVAENKKIFFSNKQKTASNWGFNIRVSVERNGAIGECYISSIGGNFE